jgi:hypothetical protein
MVLCSRLKKKKIEHGAYSTHKRLGVVKAMCHQEMESIELMEAIRLAACRRPAVLPSGLRNPGRPNRSA